GWSQWASAGPATFGASSKAAVSPANGLASTAAASNVVSRAWVNEIQPESVQVSAAVQLTGLIPGALIARGRNLDTAKPTYYALTVVRGLEVKLLKVVDGVPTVLGSLKSKSYVSNLWVTATLRAVGDHVQASILRSDTGQYLDSTGNWQSLPVRALDVTD